MLNVFNCDIDLPLNCDTISLLFAFCIIYMIFDNFDLNSSIRWSNLLNILDSLSDSSI